MIKPNALPLSCRNLTRENPITLTMETGNARNPADFKHVRG